LNGWGKLHFNDFRKLSLHPLIRKTVSPKLQLNIYENLQVNSRVALLRYAQEKGIV